MPRCANEPDRLPVVNPPEEKGVQIRRKSERKEVKIVKHFCASLWFGSKDDSQAWGRLCRAVGTSCVRIAQHALCFCVTFLILSCLVLHPGEIHEITDAQGLPSLMCVRLSLLHCL